MNHKFLDFREALFSQGIFNIKTIQLMYPGFNTDNLVNWRKKGYIYKLRNGWYCFREFTSFPDHHYLIANNIYQPSYISHQEALSYYGIIPEHIIDSVSVSTQKTNEFNISGRLYKYYSISARFYFGYVIKNININGIERTFLLAEREKAILDLLYIFDFYKPDDLQELRLNDQVLQNEIDWNKMEEYLNRFGIKTLNEKVNLIKRIYNI